MKGGFRMKGFFKFIASLAAVFAVFVGALAVLDSISNKHRIKGDYLECDNTDFE